MAVERIHNNVVVSMTYRLTVNGEFIEEADETDPLIYLHGHANIIPGLERALVGLKVGETKVVKVDPKDAYGEYDKDSIIVLSRDEIPAEIAPQVGMLLTLEDDDGDFMDAEISEVDEESITLDLNHPLAGKQLKFEIKILDLRDATEEELDHGHVHGDHGHDH
nr:peptidylprolyl isomerase [Anaerolineae bacterium]